MSNCVHACNRDDHVLPKVTAVCSGGMGCFPARMDSMPAEGCKRRLAAVVASDVVDYSRIMGQDEACTLSRLKEYRKTIIDPKIIAHSGRIVKLTGDGMLIEFPSVTEAVACA